MKIATRWLFQMTSWSLKVVQPKIFDGRFLGSEGLRKEVAGMIGGCSNIKFSPEMASETWPDRLRGEKIRAKNVPKLTKIAVCLLDLKISEK